LSPKEKDMLKTQREIVPKDFVAGLLARGWKPAELMRAHETGIFDQALNVEQGRLKITPAEDINDYVIYVDWHSPLALPPGYTLSDTALEFLGPNKFDLAELEQWLHPDQKNSGPLNGEPILTLLRESGLLTRCLGIREYDSIARAGIHIFRRFFHGKVLYFWRGLAWDREGNLRVPCLFDGVDRVGKGWHRVSRCVMGAAMPALLYPENVLS
jgi:hypothetical protein